MRLPKKETVEDKENRELKADYNKLKRQMKSEDLSDERKEMIQEDLDNIKEDVSFNKELKALSVSKNGCVGYLKTIKPIYKMHDYYAAGETEDDKPVQEERKSII